MKYFTLIASLLLSSVAAFTPKAVDRRVAFGQIAGGAAAIATVGTIAPIPEAFADGAVSGATINRAKYTYGDRIYGLKSAVDSGNFEAVAAEKSAFILFNSGVYPRVVDKPAKKAAIADTNKIFAAIKAGDSAGLKSAYSSYVATNDIKPMPAVDPESGQGYSSDYDYKVKTSAAAIYVR